MKFETTSNVGGQVFVTMITSDKDSGRDVRLGPNKFATHPQAHAFLTRYGQTLARHRHEHVIMFCDRIGLGGHFASYGTEYTPERVHRMAACWEGAAAFVFAPEAVDSAY